MSEIREHELLRFLHAPPRPAGGAYRANPRRRARAGAELSWPSWNGPRTAKVRLLDVSKTGAALVAKWPPAVGATARLRLTGEAETPWLEAEVLGAEPKGRGRHRVRLRFLEPCPNFFLLTAILGPLPPDDAEPTDATLAPPDAAPHPV